MDIAFLSGHSGGAGTNDNFGRRQDGGQGGAGGLCSQDDGCGKTQQLSRAQLQCAKDDVRIGVAAGHECAQGADPGCNDRVCSTHADSQPARQGIRHARMLHDNRHGDHGGNADAGGHDPLDHPGDDTLWSTGLI